MLELNSDLWSYLKTARSNPRSDGDDQIFWPGAKTIRHGLYRFGNDAQGRASPAGMNGGDSAMGGVGHQDRQAIGGTDRQCDPRMVSDESVAFRKAAGMLRGHNYIGVYLANRGQVSCVRPTGAGASAEAMFQPRQAVERRRVVDIAAVEGEQSLVYLLCTWGRVADSRNLSTVATSSLGCTGFARKPCIPCWWHRFR